MSDSLVHEICWRADLRPARITEKHACGVGPKVPHELGKAC